MFSGNEPDPNDPNTTGSSDSTAAISSGAGNRTDSSESAEIDQDALLKTSIGSGLMKQAATPTTAEHIAVVKVCPQCGSEYDTADRFCPKDGAPLRPKVSGDPMIGRVIADRYLILARLGEGGMGRVYVAEHVKMNRQCAIKVMSATLMNDAESTTRFAREASNAARILHPNVAAVFDYGEADRTVYLVMEYVDGESLSSLLAREGALDPRRAIDIGRQIADGLTAAHELGIVHRDLKPDNVIIATKRDGREIAKVVDFGIAKAVSDSPQDALTRSGLVIGTPEYMSPEQLLGDPVDARADIYALGCMLYQMLTGLQPFDADTREQMIRRRLTEPPPHVQAARPAIPRRLDTMIAHMLARSPNERLASAAEVSAGLDPALALAGWDSSTVARGPVIRSPRAAPTVIRESVDPGMQPTMPITMTQASASPRRIVIGAALGVAVMFGGLFVWSQMQLRQVKSAAPATPPAGLTTAPVVTPPADTTKAIVVESTGATATTKVGRAESSAKPVAKKPELKPDEVAIRGALDHFAMAMGNGEVALLKEFPRVPQSTLDGLKLIYDRNEGIRATPSYASPSIIGTRAELPFSVRLKYQDRSSKQQGTFEFRYRAVLAKRLGKWDLIELTPSNERR